jgi:hypothetical protein
MCHTRNMTTQFAKKKVLLCTRGTCYARGWPALFRSDCDDSWQDEVHLLARVEGSLVEGEFLPILTPSSLLPFAPKDVMLLGEHGTQESHRTVPRRRRLSLYWSM